MPLQKLQFRPGVNREATTYANEGGWYESEKVRFRSGFPEKIGGWINLAAASSTFKGVARDMWNWVTLAFSNLNGVGTNQKYYIESGGQYNDITPTLSTGTLGANPFTTTSGSKAINVYSAGHGLSTGTWVTFSGATAVGGITVSGSYEAIAIVDGNNYTIVSPTAASSTATGGGSAVTYTYQIPAGGATYTTGNGWGAGVWNGVYYGSASSTLSADINSSATSIGVASTSGFAASGTIVIESEIITYSGTSGSNTFTGCTRGTNGSMATSHISGVTVTQYSSKTSGSDAIGWGQSATVGVGSQLRIWSSDNYGQNLFIAPRQGSIYYWITPGSTSTFNPAVTLKSLVTTLLAPSAPSLAAAQTAVPGVTFQIITSDAQRFVIALGATPFDNDATSAFNPLLVRWSDQGNEYDWYPSTSNQAGDYTLSGGSTIVSSKLSRQEILIWTDSSLYSMQYLGPPYVWGFNLLMDNISIIAPNAIASVNNVTYWMGVDKFYSYSGRVETLPCTLRQYVFDDINQDQAYQIVAGTNEGYNEVWWFYPSANSTVNDRYVIYNHLERIWYPGTINRTFWLDSPLRQYPMGAFSVQNSYLASAISTTTQTSVTLINGYSYPANGTITIDSEDITYTAHDSNDGNTLVNCIRGANGTTAATHTQYAAVTYKVPNQVMYHEYGVDDGSLPTLQAIDAYIQSSDFDIGDGHNFGFVWRMLPDVTFNGSTSVAPQVTFTVRPRQNSGTPYGTAENPAVISDNNYALTRTYNVQLFTGQVYTRIRGRQMAFKVESTGLGTTWQLGTPRIDIRPDGRR